MENITELPITDKNRIKPKLKGSVYTNDIFINKKGEGYWVIGNLEQDTQFMLPAHQKGSFERVSALLDGNHTIADISRKAGIRESEIENIVRILRGKGLIEEDDSAPVRFNEVDNFSIKLINYNFRDIKDRKKSQRTAKILSNILVIAFALAVVLFFILNVNNGFSIFRKTSINHWLNYGNGSSNSWLGYLLINGGMILMFVFHEIGHVVAGIRCGVQPQNFSLVLYFGIIPMFYVKNKNIYSLKKQYILKVLFAGVFVNLLLCFVFLNLFLVTEYELYKILALSNLRIFLINLCPLSLSDGYFIFTVILRHPNLRYKLHQFWSKPSSIFKYNLIEVVYSLLSTLIMMGTMGIEIIWLLSLFPISSGLRNVLVILVLFLYYVGLHLLEKRKFKHLKV